MKIQAHRGASKERPENTMSAFKRAIELGAYGIELDVHLLRDGSLVVHHDGILGRCENVKGSIYDYTSENIKSFSVGEWFSSEYKDETVPFLSEVLELIKDTDIFLNVEVKGSGFIDACTEILIKLLDKYNMAERCIISSFNHYLLKDIKEKYPNYKTGILYGDNFGRDMVEYNLKYNFDAVNPQYGGITGDMVKKFHENGILVNVWTVDLEEDIQKMAEYSVDSIITNDVAAAKKAVGC